jgi:hypothetical protein
MRRGLPHAALGTGAAVAGATTVVFAHLRNGSAVPLSGTRHMASVAVIGEWGDEGRARWSTGWPRGGMRGAFQGGHRKPHPGGGQRDKLSLLPSGLVRGKIGIIGNSVVVDPEALLANRKVREQGST